MRVVQVKDLFPVRSRGVGWLAFHPGGGRLNIRSGFFTPQKTCYRPSTPHQLDITSGEVRTASERLPLENIPVMSPDGRFGADTVHYASGEIELRLRTLWSDEPVRGLRLAERGDAVAWLAFAPDGGLYAAVIRNWTYNCPGTHTDLLRVDPDRAVREFDRPDSLKRRPQPHSEPLLDGATEPVGRLDRALEFVTPPAFTPDGQTMAVWSLNGPALVFDLPGGRVTAEVPWPGRESRRPGYREHFRLAVAPDGGRVALIGGGLLVCCPLDGGGKEWRCRREHGYLTDAAFHPDGGTLFAVGRKGQALRIEAATGKLIGALDWKLGVLLCVACSHDGSTAAAGGQNGRVVVWDLDD